MQKVLPVVRQSNSQECRETSVQTENFWKLIFDAYYKEESNVISGKTVVGRRNVSLQ